MGLAASQARALLLVARKSDLEYRAQCISQRKLVLSQQTEQLAKDYSTKISNRKLRFVYNLNGNEGQSMYEDLTYASLGANNPKFVGEYRVLNNRGDIVVSSINDIPGVEQKVPVFVKVDNNNKPVIESKDVYTKTSEALGAEKQELFISYQGEDGTYQYVKIQNEDGTPNLEAQVGVAGEDGKITMKNVFDSESKTMLESYKSYQKFTKTTTADYVTSTEQSDGYAFSHYTTKTVPRTQSEDGYYYSDDGRKYIVCSDINKTNYFQNGLRTGAFILQKAELLELKDDNGNKIGEKTQWGTTPWQGIDVVSDVLNTEDDALAESEYEAKLAVIKTQDQMLDIELKQIETQHKAIETEQDSVKKVIEGNIDKTFKIFA